MPILYESRTESKGNEIPIGRSHQLRNENPVVASKGSTLEKGLIILRVNRRFISAKERRIANANDHLSS